MKEVILTGIRSNDEPTLGNYLGAMLPMAQMQREKVGEYQLNMFVPDLHSFTTPIDHENLYANTIKNLKYFVAAGLDIKNSDTFIYRQSYVSAHSELCVILNNFAYFGEISRMIQFKEKSGDSANVSVGLFDYPVLMAADMLLYGAKWVPVGDDQKQHIEITRDIATRFNNKFGEVLVAPEPWSKQFKFMNLDTGARIRSLLSPEKKMSKSISDPRGTILLNDAPSDAAKKVMGATTDSLGSVHFDWEKQPGVSNLLQILALLSNKPQEEVIATWEDNDRYGDLKKAVAEQVENFLIDFQTKQDAIDETALLSKLESDERAMSVVANKTLLSVQQAVGLRPKV